MQTTILAVALVAALTFWHLCNRRHPGWHVSSAGRADIYCGYALVLIAVYFLGTAPTGTAWEWVLGNLWALGAMVAFTSGYRALNRDATEYASAARHTESLEARTEPIPRHR